MAVAALAAAQVGSQLPASGVRVDRGALPSLHLPALGDIPAVLTQLEVAEGEAAKALAMDVNADGTADWLIESSDALCGTGGCPYVLVDGRSGRPFGEFFGSPIVILEQRINGLSVIQSFTHLSVDSGTFSTYVFDGRRYQTTARLSLEGESVQELFKALAQLPRPRGALGPQR
jgi:hypothetical protein